MRSDVFKKQIRLIGNNQNTVIEAVPFESIWGFIVLIFWTVLIFGFSGFAFLVVAFMDIAVVVKIVVGFLGLSLIAFFVGLILKMLESERIVIKGGLFILKKETLGFSKEKRFEVSKIEGLFILPNKSHHHLAYYDTEPNDGGWHGHSKFHFNYNGKIVRFGNGLNDEQAYRILNVLKNHADFDTSNFRNFQEEELLY